MVRTSARQHTPREPPAAMRKKRTRLPRPGTEEQPQTEQELPHAAHLAGVRTPSVIV